ncbi:MAG TPA: ion channel [Acidimicrobiales bacterium]|nr:ion channel [Acidimicrobiales bacterium]
MTLFVVARRFVKTAGRYREITLIVLALVILFFGGLLFSVTEHVSLATALYWSIETGTTVGYGDITPHNSAGRIIAVGVMVTTIPIVGSVFALLAGASALGRIRRLLGMEIHLPSEAYTVILGSHPIIPRVVRELQASGEPVVVVADKPAGEPRGVHFLAGDPTDEDVVRKARPERANRALIACTDDADSLVIAVSLRAIAPDLEVYALTQSARVAQALKELGVTNTLSSDELVGHTVAKSLESPHAGEVLLKLLDSTDLFLRERPIDEALVHRRLSEVRGSSGRLVLGILRHGQVDLGLADDPELEPDDLVIFVEANGGGSEH